jgi:colanic acid/amylovoran biosynthesis glycosyltransferase
LVAKEVISRRNTGPAVLVYKDKLLPHSQTFVRAQAESLERFTPYYVGARFVPGGLPLPEDRSFILNRGSFIGRAREATFRLAGVAPGLLRKLRNLNPVLVHAHFGPDGLNGLTLARALDVPLIVTHHGYDATVKSEFPVSQAHKRYLRRKPLLQKGGQLFLAVSNFIKSRLVNQGFPEDRVRVHYVGVDTNIFKPPADGVREPVVLFVGRLVENKGCAFLLRAMAKVQEQCPQARLVVIGDGPLRRELEAQVASSVQRCSFLGQQSQLAVREWMARASVLCVPCVTAHNGASEAFGIVFIEAQAMGLPAVSFANGGVPEAIADGVTGFLAPELDTESLAAGIVRLLREPELWRRFSEAGVERVRSQFGLNQQSSELEKLYEQVLMEYGKRRLVATHSPAELRSPGSLL